MIEYVQAIMVELFSPDNLFNLLLLFDTICTCFTLFKKKSKTSEQVCKEDIQALIDYHTKVAEKLKNKEVK